MVFSSQFVVIAFEKIGKTHPQKQTLSAYYRPPSQDGPCTSSHKTEVCRTCWRAVTLAGPMRSKAPFGDAEKVMLQSEALSGPICDVDDLVILILRANFVCSIKCKMRQVVK